MMRHIHVHLHHDAEFNESEHPRNEVGRFSTSAALAKAVNAPSYATVHETGGEHGGGGVGYSKSATHAQAHKELSSAGFVRENPAMSSTTSHKLGRTEARYSVSEKRSTYSHPEGHTATTQTKRPDKYGTNKEPHTYYQVNRKPAG